MDFLTHSLVGAGAARMLAKDKRALPGLSLAAVGGALLIDADPWLFLMGQDYYGRYHRVISHSLILMPVIIIVCASLVWMLYRKFMHSTGNSWLQKAAHFGWFVSPNLEHERNCGARYCLAGEANASTASFSLLLAAAAAGVALHWCYDVITGFGNMEPLWPWNHYDASLHAVSSFEAVIFSSTLGWHLLIRQLDWPRKKEIWITAGYFIAISSM